MKACDLHVHIPQSGGESSPEDIIGFAKRLGWSSIALCARWEDETTLEKHTALVESLKNPDVDVVKAIEIVPERPEDIKPIAEKIRKSVEVIIAKGGDIAVNRAAVETPEVDVLMHPEFRRNDCGLDHVLAKLAADNDVCVGFDFHEVLFSFRKSRAHLLAHMRQNARLAKKFNFPVVITSGAYSKWEMRGPRELAAFGRMVGFELEKAMFAISGSRVERNRARLATGWVMPGVEEVK